MTDGEKPRWTGIEKIPTDWNSQMLGLLFNRDSRIPSGLVHVIRVPEENATYEVDMFKYEEG